MLVNKNTPHLTENEITGLKLRTGEEVICTVVSFNDTEVVVQQPLHLVQTPEGPAFAPILNLACPESPVTFVRTNIVSYFHIEKGFKEVYKESISTIVMPTTQIIT